MRLAVFTIGTYPFHTHGAEIGIFYLAKRLALLGDEVTLYLSEFTGEKVPVENIDLPRGMKIVPSTGVRFRFVYNLSFIGMSLARLRHGENRPALVGVNIPTMLSLTTAYLARLVFHIPYFVIVHGPSDIAADPNPLQRIQCFMIRRAARTVCVSYDLAKSLRERCQLGSQGVSVIPNGYDKDEIFEASRVNQTEAREPQLVFVGSLDENKDPITLLRSFKIVSRSMPQVLLNIVGSGPSEETIREFISHEQLQEKVTIWSAVSHSELLHLMAHCAILVVTSHREGTPTVVIEALALGKPVVATAAGGLVEIINNGLNGYLVPIGGVDQLVESVLQILGDKNLRRSLSIEAEKSVQNYEWSRITESYKELFRAILKESVERQHHKLV